MPSAIRSRNPFGVEARRRRDFARRLAPHSVALVVFARRLVGDASEGEDVLQSALASAWERFREGEEVDDLRAWIARFVSHAAANQRRSLRRPAQQGAESTDEADPPGRDPAEALLRELEYEALAGRFDRLLQELDAHLSAAVAGLAAPEREALLLRAVLELSCEHIARIQDAPRGTVFARLSRAREKVRTSLLEQGRVGATEELSV